MAKTKEELTKLKNEYESLTEKLNELTEDELKQVTGGNNICESDRKKPEEAIITIKDQVFR